MSIDYTTRRAASTKSRRQSRRPSWIAVVSNVFSWAALSGVLFLLAVAVVIPRLGGATPYTILTGSMQPTLPPGTLVVVRPADPEDIGIGTVITYQVESGKPTVVTHRVVSQGIDGTGQFVYWTRGDANNATDLEPVLPVQVKGTVWYSVPYLGHVSRLITGGQREALLGLIVGGLLLYSVTMLIGAARDRRRGSR